MSKSIFLTLAGLYLLAHVQAQTPGYLHALNTCGGTATSDGVAYTYSVGEAVVFNNSCAATPGVVQPECLCVVPVSETFDLQYNARFFPNPASSHLVVETDFPDFTTYTLTAADGRTVKTATFTYQPIDLSGLPTGAYFLRLASASGQIFKTVQISKQ